MKHYEHPQLPLGLWLLSAGIFGAIVTAVFLGAPADRYHLAAPAVRPAVRPAVYQLGQATQAGGYALTVSGVRLDDQGDNVYQPGAGYRFVILTLTIKNTGRQALALAPVVQTKLRSQSGATYTMAPAPLKYPFEAGPIAPGDERQGEVSYDVPQAAHDLTLLMDPGAGLSSTAVSLGL